MDHEAIYRAYAGTVVSINSGTGAYDKDANLVTIDLAKVAEARAAIDAELAATKYQRDRAAAYAPIADQLDMQYWDSVNGTTTWKDHVAKIKSDYPKP